MHNYSRKLILRGTIFSRLELHCNKPIEPMFYGAPKLNKRKDLCAYCAQTECSPDKELKAQFKTVHPICAACKGKGRKTITKGPLHTAAAKKAAKTAKRQTRKSRNVNKERSPNFALLKIPIGSVSRRCPVLASSMTGHRRDPSPRIAI